ncbi:hypothetical protein LIT25_00975 [Bacillus sp. F19]|nr:hypothetical protein LIT25_00975 [Bacillus sp. F19]
MEDNLHRYDRYDESKLTKDQEEKIQEILLQSQREQLERQIKARLDEECRNLQKIASYRYQLREHPSQIMNITKILIQSFNGKARDALDERIKNNFYLSNHTNSNYDRFINSSGMRGSNRYFIEF